MIKIGLCDDNNIYIKELSKIIKDISSKENIKFEITSFVSGEDLLSFCTKHENYFDILFLDILMTGINGIDTAQSIRKIYSSDVYIIFVTSSKEYALDSYSVEAYSYILKPFDYNSIKPKLMKLYEKIVFDKKNVLYVKNNQDVYSINLNNVVYFESNLRKITAYLIDGSELTFYNKLSNLETEINSKLFIRSHRSFLINLIHLKNIIGNDVVTTNDIYLPISKKYINTVREAFMGYIKAKLSN